MKFVWQVCNLGMVVEKYVRIISVLLLQHSTIYPHFDGLPIIVQTVHRWM